MPQPLTPEHEQFLRLYTQHEAALHVFVRSMLPCREEADEVMQQVGIVLWTKFEVAQDFQKWAFGVARIEVLRFIQTRKRDRHVFDEDLLNRLSDRAALHQSEAVTRRDALEHCLQKLPAAQRDLVLTAYTKGTRIDELALRRNQTPMALYKLLHRIRFVLLECVERTLASEETA
jgi:RNA polymerase sigma-70 factor (ECF subfamily)